jgi:PTS system fructose-specific IIC component
VLFAVGNIIGYLISLAVGVVVGAAAVIALKSMGQHGGPRPENELVSV